MTNKEDYGDLPRRVANAAALVKLMCGVANNAAWLITLRAFGHAKQCKGYRQNVKQAFNAAIKQWHDYEYRLVYARTNRMFHVADMNEEHRRRYGDISDRQYYDFWASIGGSAYQQTQPFITSLWNKYRLSLLSHKVPDAEHVAWVLTASAALQLATSLHRRAINQCVTDMDVPECVAGSIFAQFSVKKVLDAWNRAMLLLSPNSEYPLDGIEKRNIEMGIEQLCDAWTSPTLMYQSTMDSVNDYDEVFATQGFKRKALQNLATASRLTDEELEHNNQTIQVNEEEG